MDYEDLIKRDAFGVAHIVGLSGGKDSTCLALVLKEEEPERAFNYVCTPTGDELPEMFEHWKNLGGPGLLGQSLIPIMHSTGLSGLIKEQKALPNFKMRWCTRILKIEPYIEFLKTIAKNGPVVSYIGLRADETTRLGGIYDFTGVVTRFPLREWGWSLTDVVQYLEQRNVTIPERTDCARCYHQTIGEWWLLWNQHPDIFDDAIGQEQDYGHTFRSLVIGKDGEPVYIERRGHRYKSSYRDTWPAELVELKHLFDAGNIPTTTKRQRDLFKSGPCRTCSL